MEPISLITNALTLATPYLLKTGESIAEKVGEDIWKVIKSPFTKKEDAQFQFDINSQKEKDKFTEFLLEEIMKNKNFKQKLETAVKDGQRKLKTQYQQNVNNKGNIKKQINIQQNKGNIQM